MNGLSTLIKSQPVGGSGRAARLSQAGAASGTLPALGQACVGEHPGTGITRILAGAPARGPGTAVPTSKQAAVYQLAPSMIQAQAVYQPSIATSNLRACEAAEPTVNFHFPVAGNIS